MGAMPLLPPDYSRQVARELIAFFHALPRLGAASNVFDPDDPQYEQLLERLVIGALAVGIGVFILLCIVVVRRTMLHIPSAARRHSAMSTSLVEAFAVVLLSILALGSLGGLLGEAQVDYGASIVTDAMTNTSEAFAAVQGWATQGVNSSSGIRNRAENLILSFNESDLPPEAFKLSVEAMRLLHTSKDLLNETDVLLPNSYASAAGQWQFGYFMLKATTNFAILAVVLASVLCISAIGWSMVTPLQFALLIVLCVVPISHTLIGVYFSSTLMTADFCAAPVNSTTTLLHATPAVEYYLQCSMPGHPPFASTAASLQETAGVVTSLQQDLAAFAAHDGAVGRRMQHEFLEPIALHLVDLQAQLVGFNQSQDCHAVASSIHRATDAFCESGMIGLFSMWVHQLVLCVVLVVAVMTTVLVYERVHARESRHSLRYQLVPTYEDAHMEHVYLTPE